MTIRLSNIKDLTISAVFHDTSKTSNSSDIPEGNKNPATMMFPVTDLYLLIV